METPQEAAAEQTKEQDAPLSEEVGAFSLSLMKKKKKKKRKKKPAAEDVSENPWTGTDRDYAYTELLERMFRLLHERNPGLTKRKRYVMPPPQMNRVGTRKTMWSNFKSICDLMRRSPEHVMAFFLTELGTDGSLDGNMRMVVRGKFLPKQIESMLKRYIGEYVTCSMCHSPETTLSRDSVTRLYFLQCDSCSSRRSVAPIRSGFHATTRQERRRAR